jgi:hypothetical protein
MRASSGSVGFSSVIVDRVQWLRGEVETVGDASKYEGEVSE